MAQFTEDEKIMRRLEQRFNKGVVKYRLIEDGDKILIGLSGGKDSLALLELLARRSRILKPKFTVIAVHVGMTNIPYQSDLEYLKGYSEDLGVPFVHYETFFDPSTDTRKSPIPMGAFYTVAKLPVDDSEKFCAWCLSEFNYEGETVMMAPAAGFYTTPGAGRNEVRIAYVLKKEDLVRALFVLRKALEAYPGRVED